MRVLSLGCFFAIAFPLWAADVSKLPAPLARAIDFETEVRPIFAARCFECHGPDKQKSGFRLDHRTAALEGGEHGVDIVPGHAGQSPLIHYVARLVEDMAMPPKGEPLEAAQVAVLRTWIDQGAPWPETSNAKPGGGGKGDYWAFQPLAVVEPPVVRNKTWPRNDIDRFIMARLEKERLAPTPEADRRTLIRRLSFDVIGLPPEPEAVQAFVADPDPHAYEALVERLLASPRHGERWARHWLDVVHYGESHGYDKDKPRPNAWPYRDYVIRAFNEDKPYTRFVEEQVAGDILYPDDPDGVVALGFIAAGPWDFVGHVELPESKSDGLIARYNDRDDMVMTTMSTFMSLTVHCARCHDHKFDPIPQRDYYALQAVFAGVDRADRPFDRDPAIHAERQALLREKANGSARLKVLDARMAQEATPALEAIDSELKSARAELAKLPEDSPASPSNGYHSDVSQTPDVEKWVQLDLVTAQAFDEVRLIPARPTDFADTPGFGFPVRFRLEVSDEADFQHRRVVLDQSGEDFPNPADSPVVVPTGNVRARFVRLTAQRLWKRSSDFVLALAEMQVQSGTNNLAKQAAVQALDSIESGRWGRERLVDGFDSRHRLGGEANLADVTRRRGRLKQAIEELRVRRKEIALQTLTSEERKEYRDTTERNESIASRLAALPSPGMVYAATSDFSPQGSFKPSHPPREVHRLRRGDVRSPAELMEAGSVTCFPWLSGALDVDHPDAEGERRAALARWLVDDRNSQLRRSIVNRVWHYHFGRGLVETPNDFGHMGSLPSHPELLDWLARWFQDNGGSLKALHRLILTSATYRQGSASNPDATLADADNRLLGRMNRNRLDAESLRDALLAVSGQLDLTEGGPSVQQFWFKDDHSPTYDYTRFDVDSPAGARRSIYRFIVRSVPDPFMDTMDCPDSNVLTARRSQTLTPLQALALLNNPFVLTQADHLARRLEAECASGDARIRRAYALALGRDPTARELSQVGQYAEHHGLANACRVLFNSNEFLFID